MDWMIAKVLLQDGLVTGVIYALMAVSLVLVFAVTRVILICQGEFVSYGALSFALMAHGQTPGTIYLLPVLGTIIFIKELINRFRGRHGMSLLWAFIYFILLPFAVMFGVPLVLETQPNLWVKALLALIIVVPLGPMIYRLVFEPVASYSVLNLLIISIALHFAMVGTGLIVFGAEGWLVQEPFFDGEIELFGLPWSYQKLFVIGLTFLTILGLWLLFGYTLIGKALRATAVNRRGAQLVGISTSISGHSTFLLTAFVGALAGIMLVSFIQITYETGFIIGLKGFVGAIIGGLVSYPIAAFSAIGVAIIESFTTFWASDYKEVIVFTLILPVLLIRSLTTTHHEEDE